MKYLVFLFLFGSSILCHAQMPKDSSKATYDLFHPTPKDMMRGFSTDRPDATESPYTVNAGHFQFETDLFKTDRTYISGIKTIENSFNVANLKLGITNTLDFHFAITSFASEKIIHENNTKISSGVGGITIRAKQNIWGNDDGKTALAILPFINIPTIASGEKVTGGLIIPFSMSLPGDWDVGAQIESVILQGLAGKGYNLNFLASVTTSHSLFSKCDFFLEGVISRDSEIKKYEYFIDGGLVYELMGNINLDTGVYYGIKSTSSKTYFIGLSFRL